MTQGEIWEQIVKPGIQSCDRLIAFLDSPNANVGFEIGYALGMGKEVALARVKDELPKWADEPPLNGFLVHQVKTPEAVRSLIAGSVVKCSKFPTTGDEVLFLCPSITGSAFIEEIPSEIAKLRQPVSRWTLDQFSSQLNKVGLVIWVIAPHDGGELMRDGVENAALSVVAGYAEALPDVELAVMWYHSARKIADVVARRMEFNDSNFASQALRIVDEWKSRRPNPTPHEIVVKEISRCQELRRTFLDLSEFPITELPREIASLPMLKSLYLSNTNIRCLPAEIGLLKHLQELRLDGADLDELPPELRHCNSLTHLVLHDNPKLEIPHEVMGPTLEDVFAGRSEPTNPLAILNYYFDRRTATVPLNEVKMIVVGRGGVGKTSLIDRLVFGHFDPHKRETRGISLCEWAMFGEEGHPVIAHVWDFSGQVISQTMHQYFYSQRTVYLLVLTGRENSERADAERFLHLIAAYGMERGDDGNEQGPPVLVVLNKWEDLGSRRPALDREGLWQRYPFIVGFVETDCATEFGLAQLRTRLHELIETLPYVRAPWGKQWGAVKDEIRNLTAQRAYISYEEYRKVCERNGVREEREQDSLAAALHALGLALNFRNDPRLCDSTVLSPHWLVEHSYGIIRWAEAHSGRLLRGELAQAMPEESDAKMRDYMARIMERFEIVYALEGRGTPEQPEEWLVPQALPGNSKGTAAFYEVKPQNCTRLRYRYRVLPEDLVPKFIVRTHSFIEADQVWSTGVILEKNGARVLVRMEADVDRVVEITALGPEDARRDLAGLVMEEFRRIHLLTRTLQPVEETEVIVPGGTEWVSVLALEKDEAFQRMTGVQTDEGTVQVDPARELNEFTKPEARDDSWKPTVFISYAHADEKQRRALQLRLNILANQGLLDRRESVWHDRRLRAGEDWDAEIKGQLESADVIVLLISMHAMASTYIQTFEHKRALERAAAGEVVAVPIILDGTDWKKAEYPELDLKLSRFQALCADKPVLKHSPQRDAWEKVETGLREILTKLKARGPRR